MSMMSSTVCSIMVTMMNTYDQKGPFSVSALCTQIESISSGTEDRTNAMPSNAEIIELRHAIEKK